ncbi:hypothetical protein HS048_00460 [Planomonospora sp. ID91781]|uniref:hypothetical protein n=1 Tax=Planomonospora sp. ID91781 TaxID=2738135 RepID=UPI0018C41BCC|nr:hypothetical protein [Planomonospora sp. ID91781]MBG0819239.1 hypothetical protein [Planomonospora sp. ID91781]
MKSGLARKLAAVGAGAAMLATMATGLLATPAAAASASTAGKATSSHTKPAVSVGTPKVSLSNYEGDCPVRVTFSSRIKVKAVKGKTTVAYRWLRGNGSKSSVKTFTVGKGVKYVTVKETHKIGGDTRGWEALQVLAPRKATSKKAYFKVSCDEGDGHKVEVKDPRTSTRVWVNEGNCKAVLVGRISSHRGWVRYRWVVNGHVVDHGKVWVDGSRTVSHVIRTRESLRGWASLHVSDGHHSSSDRTGFRIWCKDWSPKPPSHPSVKVEVTGVTADQTAAQCPKGTLNASGGIHSSGWAKVRYEWLVNGQAVQSGWVEFGREGGTRTVFYTGSSDGLKGGVVSLKIDGDSESDGYARACAEPKPEPKPEPTTSAPAEQKSTTETGA